MVIGECRQRFFSRPHHAAAHAGQRAVRRPRRGPAELCRRHALDQIHSLAARQGRFTRELVPLVLNGPPTATGFGDGRPPVREIVAYWPALVPREEIRTSVEVVQ